MKLSWTAVPPISLVVSRYLQRQEPNKTHPSWYVGWRRARWVWTWWRCRGIPFHSPILDYFYWVDLDVRYHLKALLRPVHTSYSPTYCFRNGILGEQHFKKRTGGEETDEESVRTEGLAVLDREIEKEVQGMCIVEGNSLLAIWLFFSYSISSSSGSHSLPVASVGVGTGGAFGDLIVGSSVFFVHSIPFWFKITRKWTPFERMAHVPRNQLLDTNQFTKMGGRLAQRPHQRKENGFFDSKVLSRQHAEV